MATITKDIFRSTMTLQGGPPPYLSVPEAASQTFVAGALVAFVSGFVQEIGSDTNVVIYGVAAEPGHNDAVAGTHEIGVYLAHPDTVFEGTLLQAALADRVSVAADLGTFMAIQRDPTNTLGLGAFAAFLNASTQTGVNIRVFTHRVSTKGGSGAVGDTDPRLLFTFLHNSVQFLATGLNVAQ